jgi:hypothetical protein
LPSAVDAQYWTVGPCVVAHEVEEVASRGALMRDRPVQPHVAPDVDQPKTGDGVARVPLDQFKAWADRLFAAFIRAAQPLRQFATVGQQAPDPAALHVAHEPSRAGAGELC